jgi:hypothetical protein
LDHREGVIWQHSGSEPVLEILSCKSNSREPVLVKLRLRLEPLRLDIATDRRCPCVESEISRSDLPPVSGWSSECALDVNAWERQHIVGNALEYRQPIGLQNGFPRRFYGILDAVKGS